MALTEITVDAEEPLWLFWHRLMSHAELQFSPWAGELACRSVDVDLGSGQMNYHFCLFFFKLLK